LGSGIGDVNRVPVVLEYGIMDGNQKFLHANDEEVGGEGVSLSEAMCGLERG
jgi:hypothetical protein